MQEIIRQVPRIIFGGLKSYTIKDFVENTVRQNVPAQKSDPIFGRDILQKRK